VRKVSIEVSGTFPATVDGVL
jgi:hypothetical protein